jgi:ubiquitin-protein ligase
MKQEPTWIEIRDARLRSDHQRMLNLTEGNDLIALERVRGEPPETYDVLFTCRGIIGLQGSEPLYGELHRVRLTLPAEYPTRPPQMRWLTPMFHPNINAEGTFVCVDTWYPNRFLDDLCVVFGRMIQYKNYNPLNPLRVDAAVWAHQNTRLLPVDTRPLRPGRPRDAEGEFDIRIV